MSNVTTATVTQFSPYIFFHGRCEDALNFYKGVFVAHDKFGIEWLVTAP